MIVHMKEKCLLSYLWEKVHSERAFEGTYESFYEGKMSLVMFVGNSSLRAYEGSYDGSHEGESAIGLLSCLLEKVHSESTFEGTYDGS